MRNECSIVRDLLPLYVEHMVSDDTASFIEEHLENCPSCQAQWDNMKNSDGLDKICEDIAITLENDPKHLKAFKKKWNRKKIMIAAASSVSTAALFFGIHFPMLTINGTDYSVVFLGLVGAAIFFAIQLLFCWKAKKTATKLIPVYITFFCFLLCLLMYCGVFGTGGGFIGNVNQILAAILAVVVCIACLGEILAWIVYEIIKKCRSKNADCNLL